MVDSFRIRIISFLYLFAGTYGVLFDKICVLFDYRTDVYVVVHSTIDLENRIRDHCLRLDIDEKRHVLWDNTVVLGHWFTRNHYAVTYIII